MKIVASNAKKVTQPDIGKRLGGIGAFLGLLLVGSSSDFDSGAFNPEVTQETLEQTVCVPGYTKAVQPSTSVTYFVKQKLLKRSNRDRAEAFEYKLDHIVPVALGGHPSKIENFELRRRGAESRKRKSEIEAKLHCLVCSGEVTLTDAQREFSNDWQAAYDRYALVKCQRGRQPLHLEALHRSSGA
jgi:hypothetical protein